MSTREKIDTRLAANFAIANKLEDGEILTTENLKEIYLLFGLAANSARTALPNHIKFRRYARETGVPVSSVRFGRRLYYMHPDTKVAPDTTERLRLLDEQYRSQQKS